MNIFECARVALHGLVSNKMRAALTMLGMIIGVAVVIIVAGIGEGAKQQVSETVNSMGTNLLNISTDRNKLRVGTAAFRASTAVSATAGAATTPSASARAGTPISSLTLEDVRLISRLCASTIDGIAPQIDSQLQIRYSGIDTTTEVAGTDLDYPYVKNIEVSSGRYFNSAELEGSAKVCVVGKTVAQHLAPYGSSDLTGKDISIAKQSFHVIGMLAEKGSGAGGQDQDDIILIPISTAERRLLNRQSLNNIYLRCKTVAAMPLAQEQVSAYLRNRHRLHPPFPDNDDFRIRNQAQLLETQQAITGTMTTMLSMAAVISLVVGGIGIMNIMLVSVTERTREIGIRKAIGATPRDILLQFLIEAAIISMSGGLMGLVLGIAGARELSSLAGWRTSIDAGAVFTAIIVSAGVGLFFGIYPAQKASVLHPIAALRFE
jgi:putative ABC transport system permease protein